MPVPSSIDDLSQTAASNSPAGSESPTTTDDYLRTAFSFLALLRDGKGHATEVDVASAATCDVGGANSLAVRITGTTTITSLGTNYNGPRFIRFAGALTLTHNASSLILPGAANITTAAGDTCIAIPISGTGWYVTMYERAAQTPYTQGSGGAGWYQLPNGVIEQFGAVTSAGSGGTVTVTFPIAFPNALQTITAMASGNSTTAVTVWRDSTSLTGAVLRSDANTGNIIFWRATGN